MDKRFNLYLEELIEWNKKFNLTSIADPREIQVKHFDDSLALLQVFPLTDQSVVDVGAGAGFPGIPLKIICPGIKLTLVESRQKKTEFLSHIVKTLGLNDVEVVWSRAEEYAKEKRECFDLAVARAVAKINVLAELCLPLVKIGGIFIAYKEDAVEEEAEKSALAIKTLGGRLNEIKKVAVGKRIRSLVLIEKISPTPLQFPRRPGMANKKPL